MIATAVEVLEMKRFGPIFTNKIKRIMSSFKTSQNKK